MGHNYMGHYYTGHNCICLRRRGTPLHGLFFGGAGRRPGILRRKICFEVEHPRTGQKRRMKAITTYAITMQVKHPATAQQRRMKAKTAYAINMQAIAMQATLASATCSRSPAAAQQRHMKAITA